MSETTENTENENNNEGENRQMFSPEQQEFVNRLLSDHKKQLKRENEELRTKFTETAEQVRSLKQVLEAAAQDAGMKLGENGLEDTEESSQGGSDEFGGILQDLTPPKGVPREAWMTIQGIKHGYGRQISQLTRAQEEQNSRIAELLELANQEKSLRQKTELAAREAEKRALLADALTRANCIDLKAGTRYFNDQTIYHNGKWMFKPENAQDEDDYLPIDKGISKEIPPYLTKANVNNGGSGSKGTSGADTSKISELEDAVASWAKRATETRRERDISMYQKAKRELEAAKRSNPVGSV